jgi:uncharacterized protein (DUF1697 family)
MQGACIDRVSELDESAQGRGGVLMAKITHVLLLRGVMPTGKNKVPMAQFKLILSDLGFQNVQTYIQTGNAIFETNLTNEKIERLVETALRKKLGAEIKAFARSVPQFKAIVKNAPFQNFDPQKHYFTLLSEPPGKEALQWFKQADFSPDRFVLKKDVLYAEYSSLISDSRFNNNFFERKFSVAATTRNSNTITKLFELAKK